MDRRPCYPNFLRPKTRLTPLLAAAGVMLLLPAVTHAQDDALGSEADTCGNLIAVVVAKAPSTSSISFTGNQGQIWLIDRRNGSARMLNQVEGLPAAPVWSPNGRQIAYLDVPGVGIMSRSASLLIASLSGDTTRSQGMVSLTMTGSGSEFVGASPWWSADGDTVFVMEKDQVSCIDPRTGLQVAKREASEDDWESILGEQPQAGPAFSPHSERVAFGVGKRLVMLDLRDRSSKTVLQASEPIYWVDWLPAGDRLVFLSGIYTAATSFSHPSDFEPFPITLARVDTTGSNMNVLFEATGRLGARHRYPTLSPDGREVAIIDSDDRLTVITIEDGRRRVVFDDGPCRFPAWQPRSPSCAHE